MDTAPSQDIKFTDEGTDNDAEDIKLTPATIREIERAHEEFNIQNLQPKTAKHYIRNVTQAIPTNLLYEILFSCKQMKIGMLPFFFYSMLHGIHYINGRPI